MSAKSFILTKLMKNKRSVLLPHCATITRYLTKHNSEAKSADPYSSQDSNFTDKTEFRDTTAEVLDVYKERLKYPPLLEEQQLEEENQLSKLNLSHGICGVFDIEDLIQTLHHQKAEDIFVARVPKEIKYVDHIVVVSGQSQRHMRALAQFVKKIFKHKKHSKDTIPKIEGENSSDWMALDMGNIALHIFSRKARLVYDLDSLWAVGPQYDKEYTKKEPVSSILENCSFSLKGLEPAE